MQLPQRYSIGCTDHLGLILRRDIIWSKPNCLPESAGDRCHSRHEYLFHFVKQPRYFAGIDEIREPHSEGTHPGRTRSVGNRSGNGVTHRTFAGNTDEFNPLGRAPGSVWEISPVPLNVPEWLGGVDHYAAFPPELARRAILGWSPSGICTMCGEGRRPVVVREIGPDAQGRIGTRHGGDWAKLAHARERKMLDGLSVRAITGYACACSDATAPTRPALIADPFGGTGTTALTASVLGRNAVTVDLGTDYCRIARWRINDPAERARALGVPKPPPVPEGQASLFDEAS
jgi:hypothetical protein